MKFLLMSSGAHIEAFLPNIYPGVAFQVIEYVHIHLWLVLLNGFPKQLYQFTSLLAVCSGCSTFSRCSHFPPVFSILAFLIGVFVSHWFSIFISLKTNEAEDLIFHVYWPFGDPLVLFCILPTSSMGCLFFSQICRNSLHVLLVICIVHMFSH